ncbi:MAG TPA: hypothetical protein PKX07_14510 [Aggregatilineales bacterium]|jgi:hypothetical protein|nr:hypothetical protein [Aggregatilineales bacterium]
MFAVMNQFANLYAFNKRMVMIAVVLLIALVLFALMVSPNFVAFAGQATSDAGHCSC